MSGLMMIGESSETLVWAQAEERRLLKQLKAIRAVIDAYGGGRQNYSVQNPRPGSKTDQVIIVAVDYLRQYGKRAQANEIMQVVQERGVQIGGNKPLTSVAAILSRSALFDNKRGEGYGLVEWVQESGGEL